MISVQSKLLELFINKNLKVSEVNVIVIYKWFTSDLQVIYKIYKNNWNQGDVEL